MATDAALKLWFSPVPWSDQVADELRGIAAHDERDVTIFRQQIEAGQMQLMAIYADGRRVGCLVSSVAHEPDRCALVLNAVAAQPVAGVSLGREVLDRWRQSALSISDTYDAATQDKIALSRMEGRGLNRYQSGQISTEQFAQNLSQEWAGLPAIFRDRKGRTATGQSYYAETG